MVPSGAKTVRISSLVSSTPVAGVQLIEKGSGQDVLYVPAATLSECVMVLDGAPRPG